MTARNPIRKTGPPHDAVAVTAATVALLMAVLSVALISHVAQHSLKHARHQATTHASPFCTWLCTAGEVAEAVDSGLITLPAIARAPEPCSPGETVLASSIISSSRAPPQSPPSNRT